MATRSGGAAALSIARRLLLLSGATVTTTTPPPPRVLLIRPPAALCGRPAHTAAYHRLGLAAAAAAGAIGKGGGGGAATAAAAAGRRSGGGGAAAVARAFASASGPARVGGGGGGSADPYKTRKSQISDTGMYLGAVIVGMVGLSYASVPLYRAFCQATGYGGAVGPAKNVESKVAARAAALAKGDEAALSREQRAAQRELRVWLEADVDESLPWRFTPATPSVTVRPGQSALAFFTAENLSDSAVTGVSTYNVVPDRAAYYFNKIQCFCFEQQRLRGRERVDMPVLFYIDPEIVDDFNCRAVHDVTLSYTFYRVEDEEDVREEDGGTAGGGVRLHGPEGPGTPVPEGAAARAAALGREAAARGGAAVEPVAAAAAAAGGERGGASGGR